jgi:hypothetical protein
MTTQRWVAVMAGPGVLLGGLILASRSDQPPVRYWQE